MPLQDKVVDISSAYADKTIFEKSPPDTMIRDVQVSRTIGAINQLTMLSAHAHDIFNKVSDEMNIVTERISKLKIKFDNIQQLQNGNTSSVKASNNSMNDDLIEGQYEILQELLLGPETVPKNIYKRYQSITMIPDYSNIALLQIHSNIDPDHPMHQSMHELNTEEMLKKFSDPTLFFSKWAHDQEKKQSLIQDEKLKSKAEKKARKEKMIEEKASQNHTAASISSVPLKPAKPTSPLKSEKALSTATNSDAANSVVAAAPNSNKSNGGSSKEMNSTAVTATVVGITPVPVHDDYIHNDQNNNSDAAEYSRQTVARRDSKSNSSHDSKSSRKSVRVSIVSISSKPATTISDSNGKKRSDSTAVGVEKKKRGGTSRLSMAFLQSNSYNENDKEEEDDDEDEEGEGIEVVSEDEDEDHIEVVDEVAAHSDDDSDDGIEVVGEEEPVPSTERIAATTSSSSSSSLKKDLLTGSSDKNTTPTTTAVAADATKSPKQSPREKEVDAIVGTNSNRNINNSSSSLVEATLSHLENKENEEKVKLMIKKMSELKIKPPPPPPPAATATRANAVTGSSTATDSSSLGQDLPQQSSQTKRRNSAFELLAQNRAGRRNSFTRQEPLSMQLADKHMSNNSNTVKSKKALMSDDDGNNDDDDNDDDIIVEEEAVTEDANISSSIPSTNTSTSAMAIIGSTIRRPPPPPPPPSRGSGGSGTAGATTNTAIDNSRPKLAFNAMDLMKKIESTAAPPPPPLSSPLISPRDIGASGNSDRRGMDNGGSTSNVIKRTSFSNTIASTASTQGITLLNCGPSVTSHLKPVAGTKNVIQNKLLGQILSGQSKLKKVDTLAMVEQKKKAAESNLGGFANSAVTDILARRKFLQADEPSDDEDSDDDDW